MSNEPSAMTAKLQIFTHGKDAYAIADALTCVPSRVINRGERSASGGLNPSLGIPQSGQISLSIDLEDNSGQDAGSRILSFFQTHQDELQSLVTDQECDFELVIQLPSHDRASALMLDGACIRIAGLLGVSITVLPEG